MSVELSLREATRLKHLVDSYRTVTTLVKELAGRRQDDLVGGQKALPEDIEKGPPGQAGRSQSIILRSRIT